MPAQNFIDVKLDDVDRVRGRFRMARLEMPRSVGRKAADEIGQIVADEIREEAPEGKTGRLKRGISHDVKIIARIGGGFAVVVRANQYYVKWVIPGRGWVYPVRAKVLHWVSKSGEDVFSMYARPTEPNPFHERGWQRAKPRVRERWTMTGEGIVRKLTRR